MIYCIHNVKILLIDPGFSKGWKESFMSGDQEPWVFRGGLTADLQVGSIVDKLGAQAACVRLK